MELGRLDSLGMERGSDEKDRTAEVFWLVEKIKEQLGEFEELRESIRRDIGSMVRLIPGLEEQRKNLRITLEEESQKIVQIEDLIPRLESQKKKLQDEMRQKQDEISRIDDQLEFLSKVETRKR